MKLTKKDFAKSFGITETDMSESLSSLIAKCDLEIQPIQGVDRDKVLLEVISRIRDDRQRIGIPSRTEVWSNGWSENLKEFLQSDGDEKTLIPKFVRGGLPIRWNGSYARAKNDDFELKFIEILRHFIFENYFFNVDNLYEFGAGTGYNLVHASRLLPNVNLIGTDFVQSSVELMNQVGKQLRIPLISSIFDMKSPEEFDLKIAPNSGVLTFGSMEQLGGHILKFLRYLINSNPRICVHVEPVQELYNPTALEDYLALWFQGQRGYTSGLIDKLKEFETLGLLKIKKVQRLNFGSMMMEGYNLVVWSINE